MNDELTRRTLLAAGASLLVSGCAQRGSQSAGRSGGIWYAVQEGDTISSLSRRSGLGVQVIIDANHLTASRLVPGSKVWLPGVIAVRDDPLAPRQADAEPAAEVAPATAAENINDFEQVEPAPPGGYVLVPRSAWTSQAVAGNNRMMGGVTRITVHHTGEHAGMEGLPDIEIIRRIERYHRNERHWAAIGYHYIVGRDAKIYEGRPAKFQGAHVLSENPNNLGISVVGDFQSRLPTERQLAALKAFLNDERDKYHVPLARVYGHRDLNKSICPGDALYGWLRNKYKAG